MAAPLPKFFTLTGDWRAIVADHSDADTDPDIQQISGLIQFTPRLPKGTTLYTATFPVDTTSDRPTAVVLAPVLARIWDGRLCTIDRNDTPDIKLTCNDPAFNLDELVYDAIYSHVIYNEAPQELQPFAFTAPPTTTTVCITDPTFPRLPYDPIK